MLQILQHESLFVELVLTTLQVKFAYGTLDDHHVLKEAASEADIVLRKLN
jgi:hypothetical protein